MPDRVLVSIPVFNEAPTIERVVDGLWGHFHRDCRGVEITLLIIDDGSTDASYQHLAKPGTRVVRHQRNRGYGGAIRSAISHAAQGGFDYLLTIDGDGQHAIEDAVKLLRQRGSDPVISGSRYLAESKRISQPPRPKFNQLFTDMVNLSTSIRISDVGCGLKLMRVEAVARLNLTSSGYLFPLEFWAQCHLRGIEVAECPVSMIYLDATRNAERKFGTLTSAIDQATCALVQGLLEVPSSYSTDWPQVCYAALSASKTAVAESLERIRMRLALEAQQDSQARLAFQNLTSALTAERFN